MSPNQPPAFRRPTLREAGRMLAYLAAYVLLDRASYIQPVAGLNITPWNPQQALALALLIWRPRAVALVVAGMLLADVIVRGAPASWAAAAGSAVALTGVFALMAHLMRRRLDLSSPFASHRDLVRFASVVVVGSLASALLYVAIHATQAPQHPWQLVVQYWVGDSVGVLVTLPLLLGLAVAPRRAEMLTVLRSPLWWLSAGLAGAALAFVFGRGEHDYFKYFYLLLPPVVGSSVRFGVNGAVLSSVATQVGLMAASQFALEHQAPVLFELQVLMAATAVTAFVVGVAVDERARAEAELRASIRFAAAGQMAAALAHELSQPITALNNYADACAELATREGLAESTRREQLVAVVGKLVAQARLTGTITRRLRDFFRTGATSLQVVPATQLLADCVDAHAELAARLGVRLEAEIAPDLGALRCDPIQVTIVLRNLAQNALESASGSTGRVAMVRARNAGDSIRIDFIDSGGGVDAARARTMFEAPASEKSQGMGVGLTMCRGIVETHGGKLWAEPAAQGRISLLLPAEKHAQH